MAAEHLQAVQAAVAVRPLSLEEEGAEEPAHLSPEVEGAAAAGFRQQPVLAGPRSSKAEEAVSSRSDAAPQVLRLEREEQAAGRALQRTEREAAERERVPSLDLLEVEEVAGAH